MPGMLVYLGMSCWKPGSLIRAKIILKLFSQKRLGPNSKIFCQCFWKEIPPIDWNSTSFWWVLSSKSMLLFLMFCLILFFVVHPPQNTFHSMLRSSKKKKRRNKLTIKIRYSILKLYPSSTIWLKKLTSPPLRSLCPSSTSNLQTGALQKFSTMSVSLWILVTLLDMVTRWIQELSALSLTMVHRCNSKTVKN